MPLKKFIKVYQKSEIIFEEKSFGEEMYIIHSGKVKITRKKEGQEVVLANLGPGEFFGEMALVDSAPRTGTAIVEDDNTRLITLNQSTFLYLIGQQPAFALTIMHTLCKRMREQLSLYLESIENTSEKGSSK